jgi:glucose-6-phosphate dehydrogenase assembly protein OpcA
VSESIWSEQDTTPSAIESALRSLLRERHAADRSFIPARVLTLVVIVDREWKGEIENRLERVGRYHASRTIVCAVEAGRTTLDAQVTISSPDAKDSDTDGADAISLGHERIELLVGEDRLPTLDAIVDPLVISDLTTVLWAPHGHRAAIDALSTLGQVVLFDSVEAPSTDDALDRATALSSDLHVVDLAWLRSTPWRERIANTFDPPDMRPELALISSVTARHHPDSAVAGLLLFGWLATRLGWKPGSMVSRRDELAGRAKGRRQEVSLRLVPDDTLRSPGLAGIAVETSSGLSFGLDRAPGGLRARRRTQTGAESEWTVMGASRGESGILGEGIRQALLRDPTYRPALAAARTMMS